MLRFTLISLAMLLSIVVRAQVTISQLSTPYVQDFNSLVDTGLYNSYSTLPAGWFAEEFGSGANTLYRAAWGQLAGGDLYSFGDSAQPERALGSIGSGSVGPVYFGIAIINNTGNTVQNVRVQYTGELWRVGNPARSTGPDTLWVAYGVNNNDLHSGSWTDANHLNFISPAPASGPSNVNLNGNAGAQQVSIDDTLYNVNLANNDTLWIRWRDENSSSYDDGMGIDDLGISFIPPSTPPPPVATMLSFTAFNTYYHQNFDSLDNTSGATASFSTLPFGWYAKEFGTNADVTYRVAYGEFAGGNVYSFGDTNSAERALGSIGSGTLNPSQYGAAWINLTGQVINNVEIKYTGEMWRQGRPGRSTGPDTLHFSYATHATSIDNGNYVDFPTLDFYSPVTNGTLNTPMNGNLPANKTNVVGVLANLSVQPNDTLWIRWTDFDSDSYDDGLGVDSFSIAPVTAPVLLNIEFANNSTMVKEEQGNVQIPVVVHNKSNFLSQVEVFIADTGNVDIATDLVISSGFVSFPGNLPDTIAYFNFGLQNSQPFEADEYFVLGIKNPVNGAIGQVIYDTVYIANYQYPLVPITDLGGDDPQGKPDSAGKNFLVEGIVHGVNYSATNGMDFYVLENGAGINVYMPQQMNYAPVAGDKVKVWGKVGYFRGLTRMEAIDSIQKISDNNTLETPKDVTLVTEAEESAYLHLDSMILYPAINTWPNNLEVYAVQAGTKDTVAIYISANTDLAGKAAPKGYFSITGIGSQFSSSTNPPYDNGYRLMAVNKDLVVPASVAAAGSMSATRIYPNPFTNVLTVEAQHDISELSIYTLDGKCTWTSKPAGRKATVNTSNWQPGVYMLQVTGNGTKHISKIVKL